MLKEGIVTLVLLYFLAGRVDSLKPPRAVAKFKCEKRVKNETLVERCKQCVDQYSLPDVPTRNDVRNLIRHCIPKLKTLQKSPKEWVKGRCEDTTERQEDIEACFRCVDDYNLPQNVTKDDVLEMRKTCIPQPSIKYRTKRKCSKKLRTKAEIETCQECINSYNLPEQPSCEDINEMKRTCVTERSGRELWVEPVLQDDDDDDSS